METEGMDDHVETAAGRSVEGMFRLFGEAAPNSIFSDPEMHGDHLVVFASAWERAGGFGFGGGSDGESGGGGGGGGGGSAQGRPVAVIRVGPEGIDVRPVIDFTKLGVTVLMAGVGVWAALRRGSGR